MVDTMALLGSDTTLVAGVNSAALTDIFDFSRALDRVLVFAEDAFVDDKRVLGSFRGNMMKIKSMDFAAAIKLNGQTEETTPWALLGVVVRPWSLTVVEDLSSKLKGAVITDSFVIGFVIGFLGGRDVSIKHAMTSLVHQGQ